MVIVVTLVVDQRRDKRVKIHIKHDQFLLDFSKYKIVPRFKGFQICLTANNYINNYNNTNYRINSCSYEKKKDKKEQV